MYQWEDTSKIFEDKKYVKTFLISGGIFTLFVFIIFYFIFGVRFGTLNQSTVIAYIFLFVCFLIVIGPYVEANYKMKRDGRRSRIAFNKNAFYFVSELTGKETDKLDLSEIKAIYFAPSLNSCFFALTNEEKDKLKSTYLNYKKRKEFAEKNQNVFFENPTDEALETFSSKYDSMNLFHYLSDFARGERIVNTSGLKAVLDSLNLKKKKIADGYLLMYEP